MLLCCGLMLPTFSPSAKAFAEGTDSEITVPVDNEATDGVVDETAVAPEAEEVATTPEPEATNEGDVRSAAAPVADTLPAGPTISDDSISLRASSSSSTVSLDLESVPEGWDDKITGVKVAVVKDGVAGPPNRSTRASTRTTPTNGGAAPITPSTSRARPRSPFSRLMLPTAP
ncbi:hypothetical protein [Eggerthella sinensis]|uniref:hypothetical protein n=1 Tax=Eggerthella sinensis TaxID=242230 RepID=UPI00266C5864|nr:hypothetical protein [Eggerthella sinensis]